MPYVKTRFGLGGGGDGFWHCVRMDYSPAPDKGWRNAWGYSKLNNFEDGELYSRGSRISNAAGVIRPRDVRQGAMSGVYDHALAFFSPFNADGKTVGHPRSVNPRRPVTGCEAGTSGLPMGARVISTRRSTLRIGWRHTTTTAALAVSRPASGSG